MDKIEKKKMVIQIVNDLERVKLTLIQLINDIVIKVEKILIND